VHQKAIAPGDDAKPVAEAFLAALDDGRWSDAADLVDVGTREAFQAWVVEQITAAGEVSPSANPSDTHFLSAAALIGVSTGPEAARLTSAELVARFAQALSRASLDRVTGGSEPNRQIRITRRFLESFAAGGGGVTVRYRTEWWQGGERNVALAGIHSLELARTKEGWRVRDADLSGWGSGHILPPPR
jgi:hypothetical protein